MPERRFDLGDYVEVKDRIKLFYELYGNGRLMTTDVRMTSEPDGVPRVLVEAKAYRSPDDAHPAVGWSWMELPGKTTYTKGSELENTETSAWGRAIAALGILVDRSIASAQEVNNKSGEETRETTQNAPQRVETPTATDPGGLIGTGVVQGNQDYELRETPDGHVLPFRVKSGNRSQIAVAKGPLAISLYAMRDAVIGQRIQVWGTFTPESFTRKDGAVVDYTILHVERIKGADFELPASTAETTVTSQPTDATGTEGSPKPTKPAPVAESKHPAVGSAVPPLAAEPTPTCPSTSPYEGSAPCVREAGHSGVHRSAERESWT